MFDYDWFHRGGLQQLVDEAKQRCVQKKHPGSDAKGNGSAEFQKCLQELETRLIVYMKDGLTYEVEQIAELGRTDALAFECVPADDNYKVGSIVIVVPFDDIARVEVFAVHPEDKPQESFRITGFRGSPVDGGREPG